MTAETADWVGHIIDRRYQVSKKLGEGGMGFVYAAIDNRLNCKVVLKVPRFEMLADPEFRQRFVDEVRALVNLSHPNIVKVTDFGTHHGTPFAVLQFLPGGSLEDRRPRGQDNNPKAVSANTLPTWLPAVADALDYIHSQKYIHRDIKPGNILFDAQKHAFISDFGVAKAAGSGKQRSSNLTGVGSVIGTPEYLAPEVVLGQPFDGRIDQYALAVTVYELLAGRVPFRGNAPTATLVMHTRDTATPLDHLRPSVPRTLAAAIERGMAKSPDERFPSCTAFAQACVAALGSSTSATPLRDSPTPPPAATVRETLGTMQAGLGTPPSTPAAITRRPAKSRMGLVLGLTGGGLALVGVVAAIVVATMKDNRSDRHSFRTPRSVRMWHRSRV
ncbi:MAG: serine/threonine-protein kinase [Gemmataceae bacterium]